MFYTSFVSILLFSFASAEFTFNTSWTYPPGHDYAGGTLNYILPSDTSVSTTCSKTYARSLPCSSDLIWLIDNHSNITVRLASDMLEQGCTDSCYTALFQWGEDVKNECTESDIEEANRTVSEEPWVGNGNLGTNLLQEIWGASPLLEKWWFDPCLRDLNTNALCKFYNATTGVLESEDPFFNSEYTVGFRLREEYNHNTSALEMFCSSSCGTQASVYWSDIEGYWYDGEDEGVFLVDPRDLEVCPAGVNATQFPFSNTWSKDEAAIAGGSNTSTGWQIGGEGGRGMNGGVVNSTVPVEANSGVALGVSLAVGMGTSFVIVLVGLVF